MVRPPHDTSLQDKGPTMTGHQIRAELTIAAIQDYHDAEFEMERLRETADTHKARAGRADDVLEALASYTGARFGSRRCELIQLLATWGEILNVDYPHKEVETPCGVRYSGRVYLCSPCECGQDLVIVADNDVSDLGAFRSERG